MNSTNNFYKDFQLGKMSSWAKELTIGDLLKYSEKKSYGKVWLVIKWFFSGKGFATSNKISDLLKSHSQINDILRQYGNLRTLIKTHDVASSRFTESSIPALKTPSPSKSPPPANTLLKDSQQVAAKKVKETLIKNFPKDKTSTDRDGDETKQEGMSQENTAVIVNKDVQRPISGRTENKGSSKEKASEEKEQQIPSTPVSQAHDAPEIANKAMQQPTRENTFYKNSSKEEEREQQIPSTPVSQAPDADVIANKAMQQTTMENTFYKNSSKEEEREQQNQSANISQATVNVSPIESTAPTEPDNLENVYPNNPEDAYQVIKDVLNNKAYGLGLNELLGGLSREWGSIIGKLQELNLENLNQLMDEADKTISKEKKAKILLNWTLENKQFPKLFEIIQIKLTKISQNIKFPLPPDNRNDDYHSFNRKTVYYALHQLCLKSNDEVNLVSPIASTLPTEPNEIKEAYQVISDALNTKKYGYGITDFLQKLNNDEINIRHYIKDLFLEEVAEKDRGEKRRVLLDWAIKYKQFPKLLEAIQSISSLGPVYRQILFPDDVRDPNQKKIYQALHLLCLQPPREEISVEEASNVNFDVKSAYEFLTEALNTLPNHALHTKKYGTGLHEFLIGLFHNSAALDTEINVYGLTPEFRNHGITILQWALEDIRNMRELFDAMQKISKLTACCIEIINYQNITDSKKQLVYKMIHYACRLNEHPSLP